MTDGSNYSNSFSLTDEIADIIRDRVLKGEYKIGEKIKENQIATELRVSRTPIREAFKILENEGLIEYKPNRGCFAKGFTRRDIEDIYAVRKALEILSVEWAVDRITPEQIRQLEDQCDLMEFYTRRGEGKKVLSVNTDFHDIIYNATGSRFMAQVLRSYKEYIEQTRKAIFYEPDYLKGILVEHKAILDAIKSGDVDRAKKAMADHLDGSKKRAEVIYKIQD
jgi:DNA-binding GntR family transcriptional regulator